MRSTWYTKHRIDKMIVLKKRGVVLVAKDGKYSLWGLSGKYLIYLGNDTPQREHLMFVSKLRSRRWLRQEGQ